MIHNGWRQLPDTPQLGGGGARMVCGVIAKESAESKKVTLRVINTALYRINSKKLP